MSIASMEALLEAPVTPVQDNRKGGAKLGYVKIPGVRSLSYSKTQTLHSCPRKFKLMESHPLESIFESQHLAFGSAFGAGLQELFATRDVQRACFEAFLNWNHSSLYVDETRNKSFAECIWGIMVAHQVLAPYFDEWEVFQFPQPDGTFKPAIELLFYIKLDDKNSYQGHIDLILQNRFTKALAVWEFKTSGMTQVESMWGNSDQTNGYNVVLQHLVKKHDLIASGEVFYLIHEVGKLLNEEANRGFVIFPYQKGISSIQEFLLNVMTDMETMELYEQNEHWPKRGNSCYEYARTCRYYGACDRPQLLDVGESQFADLTLEDVDIYIDIDELLPKA